MNEDVVRVQDFCIVYADGAEVRRGGVVLPEWSSIWSLDPTQREARLAELRESARRECPQMRLRDISQRVATPAEAVERYPACVEMARATAESAHAAEDIRDFAAQVIAACEKARTRQRRRPAKAAL